MFKLDGEGVSFEPILRGDDYYLYLRAFATESQARSLISELEPLSLPLNLEPQVRTLGPFYWLEVQDVVTPERRSDLEQLNWGDTLAVLTPIRQHAIPKTQRKVLPRINLTFRNVEKSN